jgi:hypothetical protein
MNLLSAVCTVGQRDIKEYLCFMHQVDKFLFQEKCKGHTINKLILFIMSESQIIFLSKKVLNT